MDIRSSQYYALRTTVIGAFALAFYALAIAAHFKFQPFLQGSAIAWALLASYNFLIVRRRQIAHRWPFASNEADLWLALTEGACALGCIAPALLFLGMHNWVGFIYFILFAAYNGSETFDTLFRMHMSRSRPALN